MSSHYPIWASWANLLTAFRLTLLPALYLSIGFNDWLLAASIFALAVVSDIYDGRLARRYQRVSPLGGVFDHATDALFVATGSAAFALSEMVTPWLWPLILLSFSQYLLDSKALAGQPLRASIIGRCNGIAYFALIGTGIGAQALGWAWLLLPISVVSWILVATTLVSMADRAWALIRLSRGVTK